MLDLTSTERALVRQKLELRRRWETASGPKAAAMAATGRTTFLDTLAVIQAHGDDQVRAMIDRVRDY